MQKIKAIIVFLTISFFLTPAALKAWDDKTTHPDLSEWASRKSILGTQDYLINIGFTKGLDEEIKGKKTFEWIRDGAQLEDERTSVLPAYGVMRSVNHFHNPLKPWDQAGLDDRITFLHYTGKSSLLWAQDVAEQPHFPGGDWSWNKVRQVYYWALISQTDELRQVNFAQTFRGLGHQMHLIQDAGQPEHVRNDAHPFERGKRGHLTIEAWAAKNKSFINSLALNPVSSTLSFDPSQYTLDASYYSRNLMPSALLIDTDQYNGSNPSTSLTQGIAEYTNANFASSRTIFKEDLAQTDSHYFPYPNKSSTNLQDLISNNILPETITAEDGVQEPTLYIKKERDGEIINHFVKPTYTATSRQNLVGGGYLYELDFYLNEKCHEDYASLLIPRAVGYSAGLLDYFFRGDIDMVPDDATGSGYVIVNNTEEAMNGIFEVYYDNTNNERVQLWSSAPDNLALGTLSSGNNKSGNIDFTTPIGAIDPGKYMVVFNGIMGNETGAVVGKISNICFWDDNFTGTDGTSPDSVKWYSYTSNSNSFAKINSNRLNQHLQNISLSATTFTAKTNLNLYNQIVEPYDVEVYAEDNDSLSYVTSIITFLHGGLYLTYLNGQGVDTDLRFGRSNATDGTKTLLFRIGGASTEVNNNWQTFYLRLTGENGTTTAYYKHYKEDDWMMLGAKVSPLTTVTRLGLIHYARTRINSINRNFYFDDFKFNNGCPAAP